jgi:23S rRNA (guanosine2251-2'-O)-methyltransferase
MDVLFGVHAVEEAVRAGNRRLEAVHVVRGRQDARMEQLLALCGAARVRVTPMGKDELTRLAGTDTHQGVVALVKPRPMLALEDLLQVAPAAEFRFLLELDGVEDPHNLGALLRSADGAGVDGVVLPERRAAGVTGTVAKSSAGASEYARIAQVTNLVRALEQMKKQNIWIIGLDERGTPDYMDFDFRQNCCLVLGREGAGLHDLTRRTCDHLLRIPMAGRVASLNVSVAGAVVMYEAMRQRRDASGAAPPVVAPAKKKERRGLGS